METLKVNDGDLSPNPGGLQVPMHRASRKVSVLESLVITPFPKKHSMSHYLTRERIPATELYNESASKSKTITKGCKF